MTSLGEEDWLVNSDFSISYLINPATLAVRPGPVFGDLTLHIEGLGAEISSANGRVFASATHMGDQGTAIFELTLDGYSLVSQGGGNIVAGGEYIYAISNSVLRAINLSSGLERTTSLDSAVSIGYARGDFAVFLNNDVSLTVTYDEGETFEKVFPIEGDSSLKWLDVEDTDLVLTRNFREFDLFEYKLIEQ
ncbi:hypothetical protein [Pseudomonas asiatica]|nr:hypothetical protein [Pseudomonas asiatica]MDM9589506.1 hypothetical protein [Pseudomonas asiatica]